MKFVSVQVSPLKKYSTGTVEIEYEVSNWEEPAGKRKIYTFGRFVVQRTFGQIDCELHLAVQLLRHMAVDSLFPGKGLVLGDEFQGHFGRRGD